jgi:AcrR family transcriptional regulator
MSSNRVATAFERLIDRWRDYRAAAAELRELQGMDPETVATIAAECGLSTGELHEVVTHGAGADGLMARMMQAHELDPERMRQLLPGVMRDVEILCARCASKGRCSRELDAGTAARNAPEFCPNAETFEALAGERVT